MIKRNDFLYAVQTVYLAECIRIRSKVDPTNDELTYTSPEFIIGRMNEIIHAADHIPENMGAIEAAHSFCFYMIDTLRESHEEATGVAMEIPQWIAKLSWQHAK